MRSTLGIGGVVAVVACTPAVAPRAEPEPAREAPPTAAPPSAAPAPAPSPAPSDPVGREDTSMGLGCFNAGDTGKIPVAEVPAAFAAGGWRQSILGRCAIEWGGLRAAATPDALLLDLPGAQPGSYHLTFAERADGSGARHRFTIAMPRAAITPVGSAPPLAIESAVVSRGGVDHVVVKVARLAGFAGVGVAFENGVQGWAAACSTDGHALLGAFVPGKRCRVGSRGALD